MTIRDPCTLKHSPLSRLRRYTMDPCRDASVAILTGSGESSAWSCAETEASLPEHSIIPCNHQSRMLAARHLHHHVGALPCPWWRISTSHYEARMLGTPEAHATGFACSIVPNYRCVVGQAWVGRAPRFGKMDLLRCSSNGMLPDLAPHRKCHSRHKSG